MEGYFRLGMVNQHKDLLQPVNASNTANADKIFFIYIPWSVSSRSSGLCQDLFT